MDKVTLRSRLAGVLKGWQLVGAAFHNADPHCEDCEHHEREFEQPASSVGIAAVHARCTLGALPSHRPADCPAVAANDPGREFIVSIELATGGIEGYPIRCVDSIEALCDADDRLAGREGKIVVRPAIEASFLEGKARYPEALHVDATPEAWIGWTAAHSAARAKYAKPLTVVTSRGRAVVEPFAQGGAPC